MKNCSRFIPTTPTHPPLRAHIYVFLPPKKVFTPSQKATFPLIFIDFRCERLHHSKHSQRSHSIHETFTHRVTPFNTKNIPVTLLSPLIIVESAPFKVPQQFICRLYFLHPQSFTRGGDVKGSEHQTFTTKTDENQPIRYLLWTSERFFQEINCVYTRA